MRQKNSNGYKICILLYFKKVIEANEGRGIVILVYKRVLL